MEERETDLTGQRLATALRAAAAFPCAGPLPVTCATLAVLAALGLLCAGSTAASSPAGDDQTIVHVLNRVGFGPRPGDVERVRATGVEGYIEQQLGPNQIADNGMAARLAGLATIGMSSRQLAQGYAMPLAEANSSRTGPLRPCPPMTSQGS